MDVIAQKLRVGIFSLTVYDGMAPKKLGGKKLAKKTDQAQFYAFGTSRDLMKLYRG